MNFNLSYFVSLEANKIDVSTAVDKPIKVLTRAELFKLAIEIVVRLTFTYVVAIEPAMLNLGQVAKAITTPMKLKV